MSSYVLNNIYDPLTRYNSKEGKLEPALATEWSVSDDGLTWTFKLRQGVKFHSGDADERAGHQGHARPQRQDGPGRPVPVGRCRGQHARRHDRRHQDLGAAAAGPDLVGLLRLQRLLADGSGQRQRLVPAGQRRRLRPLQAGAVGAQPADRAGAQRQLLAGLERQRGQAHHRQDRERGFDPDPDAAVRRSRPRLLDPALRHARHAAGRTRTSGSRWSTPG